MVYTNHVNQCLPPPHPTSHTPLPSIPPLKTFPSYRGEQCMECKRGWVKLDGQCLHMAAVSLCVLAGFAILAAYCWYLYKGA